MNKKILIIISLALCALLTSCLILFSIVYRPLSFQKFMLGDNLGVFSLKVDEVTAEQSTNVYREGGQALFLRSNSQNIPIDNLIKIDGQSIYSPQISYFDFASNHYVLLQDASGLDGVTAQRFLLYKIDNLNNVTRVAEDKYLTTCPGVDPYLSLNKLVFPKFSKCSEPLPWFIDVIVNTDGEVVDL
jgi:hypothetical protein